MRRLSLMVLFFVSIFNLNTEAPHGKDMKISCNACHNSEGWKIDMDNITFSHDITQFPLEGSHQEVSCLSCHKTLIFSEAEAECMSCHTDMHQQTVGFDCARCHTSTSWIVENISQIHQQSRFPLVGSHVTADCYDCHPSASILQFGPLGVECVDCHREDYISTTNPSHVGGGFSTDCMDCHKIDLFTWAGSSFIHDFFPLTQGHAIDDCRECHIPGTDYSSTSSECFSCHESDYNATTNLDHAEAGLSTDCSECHTTNPGWLPAKFNIHNDFYPLNGAHAIIAQDCASCHNGNYSNTPNTCFGCHEDDYNQTNNPPHLTAQFTTDCILCHTESAWEPATFDHDGQYFPIYSGKHDGEWNSCADCHTTPSNYALFSCIDCHEHNKNDMDDEHKDVVDYIYNSLACFDCHPTGAE